MDWPVIRTGDKFAEETARGLTAAGKTKNRVALCASRGPRGRNGWRPTPNPVPDAPLSE